MQIKFFIKLALMSTALFAAPSTAEAQLSDTGYSLFQGGGCESSRFRSKLPARPTERLRYSHSLILSDH